VFVRADVAGNPMTAERCRIIEVADFVVSDFVVTNLCDPHPWAPWKRFGIVDETVSTAFWAAGAVSLIPQPPPM
jgi:hypothetical protein